MRDAGPGGAGRSDPQLTDLEAAVLHLVAEGTTTRTIASELGLSLHEVRRVLDALLARIEGVDDAQLVAHLRSKHGYRRRRVPRLEKLHRWHSLTHGMNTRVGRGDPGSLVGRQRSS